MIPDFTFNNMIINTKFSIGYSKNGFHHQQVTKQLEKFLKQERKLYLTFNQKPDILNFNKNRTKSLI